MHILNIDQTGCAFTSFVRILQPLVNIRSVIQTPIILFQTTFQLFFLRFRTSLNEATKLTFLNFINPILCQLCKSRYHSMCLIICILENAKRCICHQEVLRSEISQCHIKLYTIRIQQHPYQTANLRYIINHRLRFNRNRKVTPPKNPSQNILKILKHRRLNFQMIKSFLLKIQNITQQLISDVFVSEKQFELNFRFI